MIVPYTLLLFHVYPRLASEQAYGHPHLDERQEEKPTELRVTSNMMYSLVYASVETDARAAKGTKRVHVTFWL